MLPGFYPPDESSTGAESQATAWGVCEAPAELRLSFEPMSTDVAQLEGDEHPAFRAPGTVDEARAPRVTSSDVDRYSSLAHNTAWDQSELMSAASSATVANASVANAADAAAASARRCSFDELSVSVHLPHSMSRTSNDDSMSIIDELPGAINVSEEAVDLLTAGMSMEGDGAASFEPSPLPVFDMPGECAVCSVT